MREGLVYSRRVPAKRDQMAVEQIVLLKECRRTVFHIAHIIPTAGHLGRKKTAEQILRRLYWPTLYWDVADFCQSCEVCQKSIDTHQRTSMAPMIPLPVVTESFRQVAKDIVGPIPWSWSGNRYTLVVCDHATRYPEAMALWNINTELTAEE